MIATDQAAMLMDQGEVVGTDGETVGKVGQVYVDNENGQLTWVTVKTGWFGANESFVPLDHATVNGSTVTVPYDKAMVKDAPNHEAGRDLSVEDENDLYTYYGVQHGTATTAPLTAAPQTATTTGTTAGAVDKDSDGYLTRSEEHLNVGTQRVEAGRARLKKFVVTEQQTVTVPVSHEEVHVVRESIAPNEATNATIGEDAVEVTLMADKVVVGKEAVAVERVKLGTEIVTEQQQVTESVRKEQIELSSDAVGTVSGHDLTDNSATYGDQAETLGANAETLGDKAEGLVDKVKNAVKS